MWTHSGAGSWTACQSVDHDARLQLPVRTSKRGASRSSRSATKIRRTWLERAKACPHAPNVLVLAAHHELTRPRPMPPYSAPDTEFDALADEMLAGREQVRSLVRAAAQESRRRGDSVPPMGHFLLAQVAVAAGEPKVARSELARAWRYGHIESRQLDLVAAVQALLEGDIERVLKLAHRVRLRSHGEPLRAAGYLLALAYDRAGAPEVARRILQSLRPQRLGAGESTIEVLLPMHERLYLTALEHRASGNVADSIRFWEVYLSRPEPEDPDRKTAERHLAELRKGKGV